MSTSKDASWGDLVAAELADYGNVLRKHFDVPRAMAASESAPRGTRPYPTFGEYLAIKILELDVTAFPFNGEQLRDAYRRVAKSHHPDCGGDMAKLLAMVRAYELLLTRIVRHDEAKNAALV